MGGAPLPFAMSNIDAILHVPHPCATMTLPTLYKPQTCHTTWSIRMRLTALLFTPLLLSPRVLLSSFIVPSSSAFIIHCPLEFCFLTGVGGARSVGALWLGTMTCDCRAMPCVA